jgi:hypothetical protein
MPTQIDQNEEVIRVLGRLGLGPFELLASIGDGIAVVDRRERVVALLGNWSAESWRRPETLAGKTLH